MAVMEPIGDSCAVLGLDIMWDEDVPFLDRRGVGGYTGIMEGVAAMAVRATWRLEDMDVKMWYNNQCSVSKNAGA